LAAIPAAVAIPVIRAPRAREEVVAAQGEDTDERLFQRAIGGDREALGVLVRRYEKGLFALLVRLTGGDRHRADDIFQETFLHAMRAAATFKPQKQFKPWLMAIAVNLVRDDARKRKCHGEVTLDGPAAGDERVRTPEIADHEDGPAEAAVRHDEEAQVHAAIARLTPLEREVVLLHFFNNLTLVETAEALSVPLGTIKSRLHAALTRLSGALRRPGV
jgi:RNA polymerase sigma-70 factor (ECF subfamily)